jgi:hypothetical protein
MAISTEGKIGIGLTLIFALGAGAVIVWPDQKLIGWAIVGLAGLGLIMLAIYHFWERKEPKAAEPAHRASTTARARTGGMIDLENFVSTADTFADVEEGGKVSAKRSEHNPATGSARRPALPFWPFTLLRRRRD